MANMAYHLGLGQLPDYPSIVLGTVDESPLAMAGAYSVFADNGTYIEPHAILSVEDSNGVAKPNQIVQNNDSKLTRTDTDLITYCLQQVVLGGTGTSAAFRIPVAGKTGTTENNVDAWFVGYTPQPGLITAVWMGYPSGEIPMQNIYGVTGGITGGTLPADMFRRFMSSALSGQQAGHFDAVPPFTGKTLGQPVDAQFPTPTTTSTTLPGGTTVPDEVTTTTTTSSGETTTVPAADSPERKRD
jgi:membrane peptidoglycan carboxypeptidase